MCLWCGYLQWKWNNESSAQAGFHLLGVIALLHCQVARRVGQEQDGVCQARFKLGISSLARCNHLTGACLYQQEGWSENRSCQEGGKGFFPALWLRTACPLQISLSPPAFPPSTQSPIKVFKRNRMAIRPSTAVRKRWKLWACWEIYP